MTKVRTIGIIGGVGPEASANFYLQLVRKSLERDSSMLPSIVLYSIPLTMQDQNDMQTDPKSTVELFIPYAKEALRRFEDTKVDVICMPCNTLHLGFSIYSKMTSIKFVSIIESAVSRIKENNSAMVGVLGTEATIKSGLYTRLLEESGIPFLIPDKSILDKTMSIIKKVLSDSTSPHVEEKEEIRRIVKDLRALGINTLLLGCTELPLLVKQEDYADIRIIDTLDVLSDSVLNEFK